MFGITIRRIGLCGVRVESTQPLGSWYFMSRKGLLLSAEWRRWA